MLTNYDEGYGELHFSAQANKATKYQVIAFNMHNTHTCRTAVCCLLPICAHLLETNKLTTLLVIEHKLINTKHTHTNLQR